MEIILNDSKLTLSIPKLDELSVQIEYLISFLKIIDKKEMDIMATLEEFKIKADSLILKVDTLNTALDGYRTLVAQMKAELDLLKAGEVLAPTVQAKVDNLSSLIDTGIAKIDETYAENFPASEPPVDPPVDEV